MVNLGVLGPLVAQRDDGSTIDLGARKQRRLLAVLAMHRGHSLSIGAIVEAMWDDPPASHAVVLQGYVSGLRKALEPSRAPRAEARLIVTTSTGYMLTLDAANTDAGRFEAAVEQARAAFSAPSNRPWQPATPPDRTEVALAASALDDALDLWRGEPYAELDDSLAAHGERSRLEELRVQAHELRAAMRIALGDAHGAIAGLESLASVQQHRESLAMLRAVAFAQAGRQVDALATLRAFRSDLLDDQGLDPSPAIAALEEQLLQQRLGELVLPGSHETAGGNGDAPTGIAGAVAQGSGKGAADEASAAPPAPALAQADAPTLKVGIVDDHPIFRMGMVGLLESLPGLSVVVDADGPDTAREQVTGEVDVLLMDLDLDGASGIELTRELLGVHPGLKVLVMTMHDEPDWVDRSLHAGAHGYLIKSAQADEIERAIHTVARGGFVVDRVAARVVREALSGRQDDGSKR
ncbi:BTAD domain-containing putative transcriptional regulator [Rarobacter faecitabidus]|uniref:Transcriptional regulator n=1 Tax=Rarobacter faecitabidus TaxID=13243 RepID=A0A542ZNU7_RARFA|nr:BTAD domain-containing putative transcriptional regulator [Rarobacter faecitabidus]TQL62015.1 transcriptional regulator [Rarobacter faecitabidus]